jgi:hypothetical protein
MIYGLSGNWHIERSIDVAADPILLTTVAVVGQYELDKSANAYGTVPVTFSEVEMQ